MTTTAPQEQQTALTRTPGTYVYDVVAQAVGRIADPTAYPQERLGSPCTLVIPLAGSDPAWQAEPGALRPATADEIAAAQ